MAALKTNYVDDVLNTSVNDKRKYNMIQNADGTVSFDDVTTYTQNGDLFGAKDINDTNTAVNVLNENLTASDNLQFKFGKDGDGNYGYYGADGSLIPFKSGVINLVARGLACPQNKYVTFEVFDESVCSLSEDGTTLTFNKNIIVDIDDVAGFFWGQNSHFLKCYINGTEVSDFLGENYTIASSPTFINKRREHEFTENDTLKTYCYSGNNTTDGGCVVSILRK